MGEIFRTFINVVSSGMGTITEAMMYSNEFAVIKVETPGGKILDLTIRLEDNKKGDTEGEIVNAETV